MTKRTPRLPEMLAVKCREQLLKPLEALPDTQTGGGGGVEGEVAHEAYCDARNARPEHVGSCVTTEEQRRVFPCMPNMPQHMQPHELPHELSDLAVSNGPHTDSDSSSTVHTHSCPSSAAEDWQEEDSQTDFYPSPKVETGCCSSRTSSGVSRMDSSSHVDSSDCYPQRGTTSER